MLSLKDIILWTGCFCAISAKNRESMGVQTDGNRTATCDLFGSVSAKGEDASCALSDGMT